jgi:hypothetical protein
LISDPPAGTAAGFAKGRRPPSSALLKRRAASLKILYDKGLDTHEI